jgi:hypothetical protein
MAASRSSGQVHVGNMGKREFEALVSSRLRWDQGKSRTPETQ